MFPNCIDRFGRQKKKRNNKTTEQKAHKEKPRKK